MSAPVLVAAFCTFNRTGNLPGLVGALREQACPVPFAILAVDNNSTDDTPQVLDALAGEPGAPLIHVREERQGITYARNRAIEEALRVGARYLQFIDDDEAPGPGLLACAFDALDTEGADCAGGRIRVKLPERGAPRWLDRELLGYLGELDYGDEPLWISNRSTPLWSGNVAYRLALFRGDPSLRFDPRYNRAGHDIGGGEDVVMFRRLLKRGHRLRYRPEMMVEHHVEPWKLRRRYFLGLQFKAGKKKGRFELPEQPRQLFGVPPFLLRKLAGEAAGAAGMTLRRRPGALRQGMTAVHSAGLVWGRLLSRRGHR